MFAHQLCSSRSLQPQARGAQKACQWLWLLLMALYWFQEHQSSYEHVNFPSKSQEITIKLQSQTDSLPAQPIVESSQRLQALVLDQAIETPQFWKHSGPIFLTLKPKEGLAAPSAWAAFKYPTQSLPPAELTQTHVETELARHLSTKLSLQELVIYWNKLSAETRQFWSNISTPEMAFLVETSRSEELVW